MAGLNNKVVEAQLEECLLLIPEVHGSNPVIDIIYIEYFFTCFLSTVLKRQKYIKKAGNGPLFCKKHNKMLQSQTPQAVSFT